MALLRLFRCRGCGYEVRSSGGAAAWMTCCTTAIVCDACKEVMDVATHSMDLGNFPPRDDGVGAAPKCSANPAHEVVLWGRKHPCPKCGRGMKEDPNDFICAD